MTKSNDDDWRERKYFVTSIEEIDPPQGVSEGDWFLYVISQGPSKIEGKRPGTLKSVTQYAEEFADNLNQRAALGYSSYAVRKPVK